jgi:uncharacterized protein
VKPLGLFFFLLFNLSTVCVYAQAKGYYPSPTGFVNDFEHDFTDAQVTALDKLVKQLLAESMQKERLKGLEVAVITVSPAMYGDETEMSAYATKIGDKWGLGAKEPKMGIIIAYGKTLRKVSIVAGQGLDNILPPAECRDIINIDMAEEYRKGNAYQALVTAVKSLAKKLGITLY